MTQSKLVSMLFAACVALAACGPKPEAAAPAEPVAAPTPAPAPAPAPPVAEPMPAPVVDPAAAVAEDPDGEEDTPHSGGDKVTPEN